jgi:hypothetical protein
MSKRLKLTIVLSMIMGSILALAAGCYGVARWADSQMFSAMCATSDEIPVVRTVEDVRQVSSLKVIPANATDIDYAFVWCLDREENLHFRADRQSVDEFAVHVVGYVPDRLEGRGPALYGIEDWWPETAPLDARSGYFNQTPYGLRLIMIVDHEGYSEVWASVRCDAGTLPPALPPGEDISYFMEGAEFPPPLPPPPPGGCSP